jgi:hypothetical protein
LISSSDTPPRDLRLDMVVGEENVKIVVTGGRPLADRRRSDEEIEQRRGVHTIHRIGAQ